MCQQQRVTATVGSTNRSHKHVVLLVDRAAFPTSKQVRLPEGVHLMLLSPQSPELQLAERLKL